jgi:hypothetical protein
VVLFPPRLNLLEPSTSASKAQLICLRAC